MRALAGLEQGCWGSVSAGLEMAQTISGQAHYIEVSLFCTNLMMSHHTSMTPSADSAHSIDLNRSVAHISELQLPQGSPCNLF